MRKILFLIGALALVVAFSVQAKAPMDYVLFSSADEEQIAVLNSGQPEQEVSLFKTADEEEKCDFDVDLSVLPEKAEEDLMDVAKLYGCEKVTGLTRLEIYEDPDLPRALAGRGVLKLRKDILTSDEYENILIHEFAHIVDLTYFQGTDGEESGFKDGSLPIFSDDLSVQFYQISWQDTETMKEGVDKFDFVSGYAMTDPFEDFAESTLYFVKHNREFRILAENNDILKQKFDFIRDNVFGGKVFNSGKSYVDLGERGWDATKM